MYQIENRTYVLVANEGDAREGEEIELSEATLNPEIFPSANILQNGVDVNIDVSWWSVPLNCSGWSAWNS